jgi:predicted dehydrogenase
MITVGVIGYGYWGPNLVRNFAETPGARVGYVTDLRQDRLAQVTARYPATKVSTDYRDVLKDPAIDAVVIATPVSSHYELGMAALRAGKHVLIEKPIASSADQAEGLIDEAAKRKLVLMVDHTIPCASTSACSSTTSMSCGTWRCTTSRSWTSCSASRRWLSRRQASRTCPASRRTSRT